MKGETYMTETKDKRKPTAKSKPDTLGQASRITGMTPAAITILRVHLRTIKAA